MSEENFLSRWSRRKSAVRVGRPVEPEPAPVPVPAAVPAPPAAGTPSAAAEPAPLPDLQSLTADSDFSAFMKPEVDEGLRRQALKKLLHAPRFNVMDGLDVYIDDYSKADPLPEGWLAKMNQAVRLGEYREPDPEEARPAGAPAEGEAPAPTAAGSSQPEGVEPPVDAPPESPGIAAAPPESQPTPNSPTNPG